MPDQVIPAGNGQDPGLLLSYAEAAFTSARELLMVAEDRVALAKERVRFAQERAQWMAGQLHEAREIAGNAQRLLAGSNELCRIGREYLERLSPELSDALSARQLREDLVRLAQDSTTLSEEADDLVTVTSGNIGILEFQALDYGKRISAEQKRYRYEVGVWYNANELVNLAEDQLRLARAHFDRAGDRVKRAQDRVGRARSRDQRRGNWNLPSGD